MTGPPTTLAGIARPTSVARSGTSADVRWAGFVSAVYFAAAIGLVLVLRLPSHEAVARTAHLGTLLAGYDPTALAFGTERPPLLSLLALPLALISAARVEGFAVAAATALLGGLGVTVAYGLGRWAGLARAPLVLYVAAFGLHPMLLLAGATGLPEALYATLVLGACAQFVRWLDRESITGVIMAGTALGLAFLLRYNVLWMVAVMALAMYAVGRRRGETAERKERAQADVLAFAAPVVFFAGLWLITAWFIDGQVLEFVRRAAALSGLAANDPALAREMAALEAPGRALQWVGAWSLAISPLSVIAVVLLATWAVLRGDLAHAALTAVLVSLVIPESVALLSGRGQPHVTHLFVVVVPAFVAVAHAERRRTGGRRPPAYDRRTRRRQVAAGAVLALGSIGAAGVLPLLPPWDTPAAVVMRAPRGAGTAREGEGAVKATAAWIREHARAGEVLADPERSAEVMVATKAPKRFYTPGDLGGAAVTANPSGITQYVLVRRPVPGTRLGTIERAHPRVYESGAPGMSLVFESGEYRIYRLEESVRGR